MLRHRQPKHCPGDNALLRRAFERAYDLPERELERRYNIVQYQVNLNHGYREWLRSKGIDPDTGKMTDRGFAFFRALVEQQNVAARAVQQRPMSDVRHSEQA